MPFGFIAPKTLNYLAFQYSDFERTWWRLFQKRVVRTKFDLYIFFFSLHKDEGRGKKELLLKFNSLLIVISHNFEQRPNIYIYEIRTINSIVIILGENMLNDTIVVLLVIVVIIL